MVTFFLVVLAAHQGEEFVIILPAVMLVGAFFIMRWANQNDEAAPDEPGETEAAGPPAVGAVPSPGPRDVDETTR